MIKGKAKIVSDMRTEFLDKGESIVISKNEFVKIDNTEKEPIDILKVNISN